MRIELSSVNWNSYKAGIIENTVFLLGLVFVIDPILGLFAKNIEFLWSFTFFAIEALAVPAIDLCMRYYRAFAGGILGIIAYFVVIFSLVALVDT